MVCGRSKAFLKRVRECHSLLLHQRCPVQVSLQMLRFPKLIFFQHSQRFVMFKLRKIYKVKVLCRCYLILTKRVVDGRSPRSYDAREKERHFSGIHFVHLAGDLQSGMKAGRVANSTIMILIQRKLQILQSSKSTHQQLMSFQARCTMPFQQQCPHLARHRK